MNVTIRDVAKKLGLSITTVSRALDGYGDVSEETRRRVILAAQEIGYEPTFAARQLRRQRSDAIGYILPTVEPRFSDPFYSSFVAGVSDEAARRGFDLVVSSSPAESETEQSQYRRWTLSKRVDGVVLNRVRIDDWRIGFLLKNSVPFTARCQDSLGGQFPVVKVDERGGFARLVKFLAQKGWRRIAYLGGPVNLILQNERFNGYRQGLEESGIPFEDEFVADGDLTEDSGYLAARRLISMPHPPDALVACNDLMALGALRAVEEAGLQAGKDMAVTGYDGIKEAEYSNPPLTTLLQPTYDIARKLTEMLIACIKGEGLDSQEPVFEPQLIVRASSG